MRTKAFCLLFLQLLLAWGCNNNPTADLELKRVSRQRDSLLEVSARKDSSINEFLTSFNEIENNLASIRAKQENLTLRWNGDAEIKKNVQDEVIEDIRAINDLMEQNQKKISSLNAIIKSNDNRIQDLNGMVNVLIQHIEDKNYELSVLNNRLMEKNKELAQRNKIIFHVPK